MRRIIRAMTIVIVVAFAETAAAGTVDPATIAAVDKAAAAFADLAKDAYKTGNTAPRQSDPAVKALLDVVLGTGGLAGLAPIAFSDINKLSDWSLKAVVVGNIYVFAGTGVADPSTLQSADDNLQKQIAKNTVAYAPELGRYLDASIQVTQALVVSVMTEMAAHPGNFQTPQVEHGLAQMRSGLVQTVRGVLTTLLTPGLDPAWMRDRLPVLNAAAPTAAKFLTVDERKQLIEVAQQVAAAIADPAVKQGLAAFAKSLGS